MKKLIVLFAILLSFSAEAQRLWVTSSYLRLYNPTSKQDFYTPLGSITRMYVKGNVVTVYSTEEWNFDVSKLTQYNGGTVPAVADIVEDITSAISAISGSELVGAGSLTAQDTIVAGTSYYLLPFSSTCVWGMGVDIAKNTDSVTFVLLRSLDGIRTTYAGIDTAISTASTVDIGWEDWFFTADTLILEVIATDTVIITDLPYKKTK